jgi:hypothetical protein
MGSKYRNFLLSSNLSSVQYVHQVRASIFCYCHSFKTRLSLLNFLHLKRRDQYLGDVEVVSHIVGEQTLLLQIRHSICTVIGYFLSEY